MADRGFLDVLKDLNEGQTVDELNDALANLVAQVRGEGKPGTLTITFELKPTAKGAQIEIRDQIKVKPPKADKGATRLFVTDDNVLVRKDPRQPQLSGLRSAGPAPVERIDRRQESANE